MDAISAAMRIAGSGLEAQSLRVRTVSENIANASSLGSAPGADPYRRKTIVFEPKFDKMLGAEIVNIKKIGTDDRDFSLSYDPTHPAANVDGYVKMPNVNPLIEMTDMREATRSFDANLSVIEQARGMAMATIALLEGR
ncbi:MAG: flagellar basal body rod protein FlgC [Parvularculaceae bacterium]|nr:flagellar basal body rod protein FlgC [Parvularculaceae bacterium]